MRKIIQRRIVQSTFVWRWVINFRRAVHHRLNDRLDERLSTDVARLRSEGIIVGPFEEIFDRTVFGLLDEIMAVVENELQAEHVQTVLRDPSLLSKRKDYRIELLSGNFEVGSPFIQLAIHPRVLDLVNGYLGMRSYLRYVNVWYDFPTHGLAKETQLWHRDDPDHLSVKLFIYLKDVDEGSGPFCFIPRTHPLGSLNKIRARAREGRTNDEEMASAVPPAYWKVCTGPAKTVVLADTTGFHKGLKPETKHRLLLVFHYTSGKPRNPRSFVLRGPWDIKQGKQKHALLAQTGSDETGS